MRLPRPTTRRLMMLVALAALVLGRPIHFWRLARHHHFEKYKLVTDLELYLFLTPAMPGSPHHPDSGLPVAAAIQPVHVFCSYHHLLEGKYLDAYRHPWRLVDADPPAPPEPSTEHMKRLRLLLGHDPTELTKAEIESARRKSSSRFLPFVGRRPSRALPSYPWLPDPPDPPMPE